MPKTPSLTSPTSITAPADIPLPDETQAVAEEYGAAREGLIPYLFLDDNWDIVRRGCLDYSGRLVIPLEYDAVYPSSTTAPSGARTAI